MTSNLSRKLMQVKPGTLHVGVDLALDRNVALVMDERADTIARFSFSNDRMGYDYLHRRLERLRQHHQAPEVLVAMEPTNYFWKLLAAELEQQGRPYRLVNAYTVKKHREGDQLDRSKDDPRDAFTIADLSRTGKYTETQLQRGRYAELRQYVVLYDRLQGQVRREKGCLSNVVGQYFPELTQVFKRLSGKTVAALLRSQAVAVAIRQMSEEAFLSQVRAAFQGKRLRVTQLRIAYQRAQVSVGLTDGIAAGQLAIQMHLGNLERLQQQLEQVQSALLRCFFSLPEARYLVSVRGLGILTAAILLAEIGDPRRYRNGRQLVKLAGIQPTPNRSGRKQRSRTPMSHQGRPRLRTALFFACMRLIRVDRGFAQCYHRLQHRQRNPLNKMQALGVLMNKLLRILWTLMRHQTCYDPARTLAA